MLGRDPHTGFSIAIDPKSQGFVVASAKGNKTDIQHWHLGPVSAHQYAILSFPTPSVRANMSFSADGRYLIANGFNDQFVLWHISGEPSRFEPEVFRDIHALAFVPIETGLMVSGLTDKIMYKDGVVSQEISAIGNSSRIKRLLVSHDGKYVAAATGLDTLVVVNRTNGDLLGRYWAPGSVRRVLCLAFTPQNHLVALVLREREGQPVSCDLVQWDGTARKWKSREILEGRSGEPVLSLSSDGAWMAETRRYRDRTIRLREVASPEKIVRVLQKKHDNAEYLAFSPDGSILACATAGAGIRQVGNEIWLQLWETATGKEIAPAVSLTPGSDVRLALSPNGKLMAQAGYVGLHSELQLWGVPAWSRIGDAFFWPPPAVEDTRTIYTVDDTFFSPDGKKLAVSVERSSPEEDVAYRDGVDMYLWNMDMDSWKAKACGIANRNLSRQEWLQYLGEAQYRRTCPELPAGEGVDSEDGK